MESVLIILAAGSSSRFGDPKQYLTLDGKSLLNRTIEIAKDSNFSEVVVVAGAFADSMIPEVGKMGVHIVDNPGWQEGMGSSIREGVRYSIEQFNPTFIGISVIDQPFLKVEILNQLLEHSVKSENISASKYGNGQTGVPACFPVSWKEELMSFYGDRGARDIFKNQDLTIEKVDFPKGMIDIDTPEDLTGLALD